MTLVYLYTIYIDFTKHIFTDCVLVFSQITGNLVFLNYAAPLLSLSLTSFNLLMLKAIFLLNFSIASRIFVYCERTWFASILMLSFSSSHSTWISRIFSSLKDDLASSSSVSALSRSSCLPWHLL